MALERVQMTHSADLKATVIKYVQRIKKVVLKEIWRYMMTMFQLRGY